MDGRMDMDGWTDEQMDMDGWMNMDGQMHR